ncbi:MAG: dihydroorotase [Eubacterium sp.]|nr:dihydroorotase [Eubacterium sp.]
MEEQSMIIRNGIIVDPSQKLEEPGTVYIRDNRVERIVAGRYQPEAGDEKEEVIDAAGCYVFPGLIDLHVHFRDPGQTHKEDIESGAAAAAAGGVTTVCAMPNTSPTVDNVETLNDILRRAKELPIRVEQLSAITVGENNQELVDIAEMKKAGAIAFSEDGKSVMNTALFREALSKIAECGGVVMSHCEDRDLVAGGVINAGEKQRKLGLPGITNAVEDVIAARDIFMAAEQGVQLHLCHCSTRGSVELMRMAKRMGLNVTAEVCPHHFTLSDADIPGNEGNYKMNPPLRSEEDVQALIEGLRDGSMDVISTDHAPHTEEEKSKGFSSPFGIVGLETSAALTFTALVGPGLISMSDMVRLMSTRPAEIIHVDHERGTLKPGALADVTIFDPGRQWIVEPEKFRSRGRNTPYAGKLLLGKTVTTICNGKIVYQEGER